MFSFIRKRRKQLALRSAIWRRNLEQVDRLVSEGCDVNFVLDGSSPLSMAVWAGDKRIVDYLLAHGASPSGPGNQSLLVGLAQNGDHELVDLALSAGHSIHFRPHNTPSALQAAAFRNRTETIQFLIARGATKDDFDVRHCRWTSIHSPTIRMLLDLGVEVPGDIIEHVRAGNWL